MFGYRNTLYAVAALTVVAAGPATAVTVFNVSLNGANEVPPRATPSFGSGTLTLSDDQNILTANISFGNLTAPAIEGHLHCCAPIGANAPVALPFSVTPSTSGVFTGTVNLSLLASYDAEFLATYGGTVATLKQTVLNELFANLGYVNIHTPTYPDGEIRGQALVSGVNAVPEPAQWAMLMVGFAMVGTAARRRTRLVRVA